MRIWPTEAELAKAKIRRLKHKQFYCVIDWPYWYNTLITRTTIAMMAM